MKLETFVKLRDFSNRAVDTISTLEVGIAAVALPLAVSGAAPRAFYALGLLALSLVLVQAVLLTVKARASGLVDLAPSSVQPEERPPVARKGYRSPEGTGKKLSRRARDRLLAEMVRRG